MIFLSEQIISGSLWAWQLSLQFGSLDLFFWGHIRVFISLEYFHHISLRTSPPVGSYPFGSWGLTNPMRMWLSLLLVTIVLDDSAMLIWNKILWAVVSVRTKDVLNNLSSHNPSLNLYAKITVFAAFSEAIFTHWKWKHSLVMKAKVVDLFPSFILSTDTFL